MYYFVSSIHDLRQYILPSLKSVSSMEVTMKLHIWLQNTSYVFVFRYDYFLRT